MLALFAAFTIAHASSRPCADLLASLRLRGRANDVRWTRGGLADELRGLVRGPRVGL